MRLPPDHAHTNDIWPKAMAYAARSTPPATKVEALRPVEVVATELLRSKLPSWRRGRQKRIAAEALPELLDTLDRLKAQGARTGVCLRALGASPSALVLWRRWPTRAARRQQREALRASLPPAGVHPHDLLPDERAALLACRDRHPATDYRRLSVFLAREHGVHVAADTVYAVLEREGRLSGSRRGPVLWNGRPATQPATGPGQRCAIGYLVVRWAEGGPIESPDMWLLIALDTFSRRVIHGELLPFDAGNQEVRSHRLKALGSLPQGYEISTEPSDLLVAATDLGALLAEKRIRLQSEWSLGFAMAKRYGRLPRVELMFEMGSASRQRLPEMQHQIADLIQQYNASYPVRARGYLPPDDLQRGPEEVARLLRERQEQIVAARARRVEVHRAARRAAMLATA